MPVGSMVFGGGPWGPRAISRRAALGLVGGAACATALPAWANRPTSGLPAPQQGALHYQIRYVGAPIGRQSLVFRHKHGRLFVDSQTMMKVGLGPLTAYQFAQKSHELWEGGRLALLYSHTDDDGEESAVSGIAIEDGFAVTLAGGTEIYPADIFTNNDAWSVDALEARHVLDVRDGELMPQRVEMLGSDVIEIDGQVIKTRRYAVQGKRVEAQLWYDDSLLVKADVTRDSDTVEYFLKADAQSAGAEAESRADALEQRFFAGGSR